MTEKAFEVSLVTRDPGGGTKKAASRRFRTSSRARSNRDARDHDGARRGCTVEAAKKVGAESTLPKA